MYYINDKKQLNSVITEFRKLILAKSPFSTPKPQKFKELIAGCFGFKSYAALVSYLDTNSRLYIEDPGDLEYVDNMLDEKRVYDFSEMKPSQMLAQRLKNGPYGMNLMFDEISVMFKHALDKFADWDEQLSNELLNNSILMACEENQSGVFNV